MDTNTTGESGPGSNVNEGVCPTIQISLTDAV